MSGPTHKKRGATMQRSDQLHAHGGIYSARLGQWGEHLNTTPRRVVDAIRRLGLTPWVDSARAKTRGDPRPRDPQLRCIALSTEQKQTLESHFSSNSTHL